MHPTYRGLAFLLSLGTLPIGCNNNGDKQTDSTGGTPGTDPTANTGTGTDATDPTAPTPTTGPDPTTTTTGPTGGTDPGTTAPDPTTTGPITGDETGLPPPSDPTCIAYAAKIVECMPRYVRYQQYYAQQCEFQKNYGLRVDGQPCADAFDAVYVCLSMADCAALAEPGACASEQAKIPEACPSFDDEEPGTDTVIETGVST